MIPPGEMLISTPVAMDFANLASSITIQGSGSDSIIHIATGLGTTALELADLDQLMIQNVTFAGTVGVSVDAQVALRIDSVAQATISNSLFFGLGAAQAKGAVLWASHSDLTLEDTSFEGCTAGSFVGAPVIFVDDWTGFTRSSVRSSITAHSTDSTLPKSTCPRRPPGSASAVRLRAPMR